MGFGTELQGKSSHEDLLQLQDTEIRLLESLKKCISQRIKCDREYAGALSTVITSAQRFDSSGLKNSPVYQAWNTVVKETENMVNVIRSNSDKLCVKTLEKVVQLINEKKHTRKLYSEERHKLDTEYKKLQEDVCKLKLEYERLLSKVEQDKTKYKEICQKGKSNSKSDEAKTKYLRSNMKLHRVHNDYVAAIEEVTIHQKHYLRNILPSMLDFQQDVQEALVLQCKEMLQEYAQLTDCCSENFVKSQKEIHRNINSIRPSAEYSEFLNDCRSDPLTSNKFEFGEDLLRDYEGTLIASEIALDDMTYQTVLDSRSTYEDRLSASVEKKNSKENELKTIKEELAKLPPPEEMDEEKKIEYRSQTMIEKMLGKEITELECSQNKYQLLYNLFNDPLTKLGENDPPAALETYDPEPFLVDIGNGSTHSQESVGVGFGKKFSHLKNHIAAKIPFKRGTTHPPKPPSRETIDLVSQNADETVDCLKPERQYSDDSYNLTAPKKRGPVPSGTSDNYQQCTFEENVAPSQMTLTPGRPLTEEEWFHGVLPREEVQRLLKIEGDYLVRESKNRATGKTQHVLSVMWSGYKHFIIQGQEGSWRFEGESFPTVQELILNQHKSGVPVTKRSEAILKVPIYREQWELRNDDIELGQKIGNGNFGDVFKGIYRPKSWEIAVKTCRETLSDDQKKKFLQEGRILKQYDHPNIVKFIGIAAQKQPVMIVMEFVPGGSLLNFLRKRASEQTKKQLVKLCEDASAGMAYLESKNCIHRDLAARNCLVGKLNLVKISDFGMSREEEEYVVSGGLKQIPIKWTAPEALNYGTYTSACDVWSFGILMWEVFSFGATPYSGLTNSQARERVDDGYRMPAPEDTPEAVYDLMLHCWEEDSKKRPRFEEMFRDLQKARLSL